MSDLDCELAGAFLLELFQLKLARGDFKAVPQALVEIPAHADDQGDNGGDYKAKSKDDPEVGRAKRADPDQDEHGD